MWGKEGGGSEVSDDVDVDVALSIRHGTGILSLLKRTFSRVARKLVFKSYYKLKPDH